jgi:hypothetical protein
VAFPYSAAILVVIPVNNVVTAVFDGPVSPGWFSAHVVDWPVSGGLLVMPYAISKEYLPLFFLYAMPLDDKGLANVREVKVAVEFRGGPDFFEFRFFHDPAAYTQ